MLTNQPTNQPINKIILWISEWNYVLNDGVNIPRQLTDMNSEVTMFVRYNPWGKPIETSGIGNFDASYIGTLIDATTGLIYVGNGQYYDPETGRFLTRGVNPNSPNPYVPFNPIGAVLGPLAIISGNEARKKLKKIVKGTVVISSLGLFIAACTPYVVLIVFGVVAVAAVIGGCGDPPPSVQETETQSNIGTPTPGTVSTNTPESTEAVVESPATATPTPCCNTPTPSPMPTATPDSGPDQMDDGEWGPKSTNLYNLYLRMHREKEDNQGNKTLWWRIYGQDGNFTIVDFTAMVFIREVANSPTFSNIDMNDYIEAMGRHAYTWCDEFSGYNCNSTTNKGMMYFLVEWSGIVKFSIEPNCAKIAETCNLPAYFQSIYGTSTESWALKIANGIRNPESTWTVFDKNALWDAANIDPQAIKIEKANEMHTEKNHKAHYEWPPENIPGKLFIATFCESVFLRDEMALYNNWGCELPPN
ncbi:MAG: hypothetical protein KF758_02150 [Anaerolineales bacterium]|nr:hypothetical protein [Anaerolineales bacterium]